MKKIYILIFIVISSLLPLTITKAEVTNFTKYYFSNEIYLEQIAKICQGEQGSPAGSAAEASLIANRYELYRANDGNGDNLANYVRTSGWWGQSAGSRMDASPKDPNTFNEIKDAVRKVLVDGKRTLPKYIDEHDCYNCCSLGVCINSGNNNGVSINLYDHSQYIPFVTKLHNTADANYTFYTFPTPTSDPFGYTNPDLRNQYGDFHYTFDGAPSSGTLGHIQTGIGGPLGGLLIDPFQTLTLNLGKNFNCKTVLVDNSGNLNSLGKLLQGIFTIMKIAAPALAIALSLVDYVKTLTSSEENLKKINIRTIKRTAIGLGIFILPYLLDLLFHIYGLYDISTCNIK